MIVLAWRDLLYNRGMAGQESLRAAAAVNELGAGRFEEEFEYYWERLARGMESLVTAEKLADLKVAALQKEISFYEKVYNGVTEAALASSAPITCLFDIDGTIGEINDDNAADIHTLLRPALSPLIYKLAANYPERLRFGILSLRPQSSLDEELEQPTFLSPIRPFLAPEIVKSSEYETRTDPLINTACPNEIKAEIWQQLEVVIDATLLEASRRGDIDIFDWYDPKILMLARYLEQNPGETVIMVDDLPVAGLFNRKNSRIKGVCVSDEKQILIP